MAAPCGFSIGTEKLVDGQMVPPWSPRIKFLSSRRSKNLEAILPKRERGARPPPSCRCIPGIRVPSGAAKILAVRRRGLRLVDKPIGVE